jgi:betaine-aldehyde dehydrogenase
MNEETMSTTQLGDHMLREHLFIGGSWHKPASPETIPVISPITEDTIGRVPKPTEAEADRAVAAARRAFDEGPWPQMSADERGIALERLADSLHRRADLLCEVYTAETGAPIALSRKMTQIPEFILRQYARMHEAVPLTEDRPLAGGVATVRHEPVGVVAGISPWNAPVAGISFIIGPALAAGCTLILKPAHEAPLATYLLADAVAEAELPPGVVSIVPGDAQFGEYLVRHPGVDKIAFTGSTAAGRRIMSLAADRMARVTLELGGKSPAIVCDDADFSSAVPNLVMGGLGLSGQVCSALTRILVSERRHDELVDAIIAFIGGLRVGDPRDPATDLGPLTLQRQRTRVEDYIALGRSEGGKVVIGGGRPADITKGWFVEPTVFDQVANDMRIAREEIFGPVLSVISYRDENDAVKIANDSPYGLSSSIYTQDSELAEVLASRLRAGQVHINGFGAGTGQPFGGYKMSGIGRKGGPEGLEAYQETKLIERHPPA